MNVRFLVAAFLGLSLLIGACSDPILTGPYAAGEMWLCKPGQASNRCLELDQTITYVFPDNRRVLSSHITAVNPAVDCFYLYPTVDLGEKPGNTEHLNDAPVLKALFNQAARFTELCNVYAPFYHQMTNGTYGLGDYRSTEFYDVAYNDVSEAFSQYLLESGNRPFVLMGHSQGAHMVLELLARRFENNPELRKRLVSALVIGPLGRLQRPEAAIMPDSYANIPLCTRVSQTGCIVTFDTVAAGNAEARVADARPCVNPTHLGGDPGVLETVIWPTSGSAFETPWVGYSGRYTAHCDADGYLAIDTLPDMEEPAPSLQSVQAAVGGESFHVIDFNWAIGDLLRIVAIQARQVRRVVLKLPPPGALPL
jgi:pimeloyl-ACP methyl ester carboxylesterase